MSFSPPESSGPTASSPDWRQQNPPRCEAQGDAVGTSGQLTAPPLTASQFPGAGGTETAAPTLGPTPQRPSPVSEAELQPEELAEARQYGRIQRKCLLADRAMDLLYWAIAALLLSRPLESFLGSSQLWGGLGQLLARSDTVRLVALFVGLILVHAAVSLPLAFYAGYVVEQRFGFSRLTVLRWAWRYVKQFILALLLSLLIVVGLFWIIRWTGPWWWLLGAGAFFLLSVVLGQLAPVLILPLFYRVERLDRPELLDRLQKLAEGTGLRLEGIYRLELSVETVKANAALAGLGRTRRVLLGDTLLEHFLPEEIETIFAHEVGHHVHRHIGKMLLMGLVGSAIGFFVCDGLLAWWVGLGKTAALAAPIAPSMAEGLGGVVSEAAATGSGMAQAGGLALGQPAAIAYSQFPVWAMPMLLFLLLVLGSLSEPLWNALSRWHERQADLYALNRTGNPEAFQRAFRRLARLNKEDPDPPAWEVVLFHSHPPIRHRLALAERFVHQKANSLDSE